MKSFIATLVGLAALYFFVPAIHIIIAPIIVGLIIFGVFYMAVWAFKCKTR